MFVVVNGALIVLKLRPNEARGAFEVPLFVPALGILVCATLIFARVVYGSADDRKATLTAGGLVAIIALLYLVLRPKTVVADDDEEDVPAAAE